MSLLEQLRERFKRRPSDVVGIDLGAEKTRAVRMRLHNGQPVVVSADVLDPIQLPKGNEEPPLVVPPLVLPPKLRGRYGCLAVGGEDAIVKLLSFPGQFDEKSADKIGDNIGIDDPENYRISYKVISEGHGRAESKVLVVALPEAQARLVHMVLPAGTPAPFSLEVSSLAAMTSFLHGPATQHMDSAVGVVDFGFSTSSFALFRGGMLVLIRMFEFGTDAVVKKIRDTLGVDAETSQRIISDGSFDISHSVSEVMEPFIKHLIVSRDFVERRENTQVSKVYVSGRLATSRDSLEEMRSAMDVEIGYWNPLEGLECPPGTIPEGLQGEEWQFAAAVGACLAALETEEP
jgi:Tfp pilus assembly PilM family ATPase